MENFVKNNIYFRTIETEVQSRRKQQPHTNTNNNNEELKINLAIRRENPTK